MNAPASYLSDVLAAARTGAVLFDRAVEGRLRLTGRDRLDLLHRMSTNDVNGLNPGEARRTVLTTAIGRMVDAPWVLHRGETALLLTGPGQAEAVRRWLNGYVFYNDKVKFETADGLTQFALYGPRAGEMLGAAVAGAEALTPGQFIEHEGLLALRGHPFGAQGYTLILPVERAASIRAELGAAGVLEGDAAAYHSLRVALGEPEAGREISEDYIPLEANLWSAVSFSKGCYIGQEIIARMESRGKLARRLMGLRLSAAVPEGAEVFSDEVLIGRVTSTAMLPEIGPLALAYLKSAAAEAGTQVRAGAAQGEVVELPFI